MGYPATYEEQQRSGTPDRVPSDTYERLYNKETARSAIGGIGLFSDFFDIDPLYVTKEGKIMIRLVKAFKAKYDAKLPPEFIAFVGSRLNDLAIKPNTYHYDFTNEFDWSDGQFGHSGSCWFHDDGPYGASLPTFQNNGGWAIRFYSKDANGYPDKYDHGIARTWVKPEADSLLCFNTYGNEISDVFTVLKHTMSKYGAGEVKLTRKIRLANELDDSIPYINGGSGFAVSDSKAWDERDFHEFSMDVEEVVRECDNCGCRIRGDVYHCEGDTLCSRCIFNDCVSCDRCDEYFYTHNLTHVQDSNSDYCTRCLNRVSVVQCRDCAEYFAEGYTIADDTGNVYCYSCECDHLSRCNECGDNVEDSEEIHGRAYCRDCAQEIEEEESKAENV